MMHWSVRIGSIVWLFCASSVMSNHNIMDGSINTSDRVIRSDTCGGSNGLDSQQQQQHFIAEFSSNGVDPLCIDSQQQQHFMTDLSSKTPVTSPAMVLPPSMMMVNNNNNPYFRDHIPLFIVIILLSIALGVVMGLLTTHCVLWPHHHHHHRSRRSNFDPSYYTQQHKNNKKDRSSRSSNSSIVDASGVSYMGTFQSIESDHHHDEDKYGLSGSIHELSVSEKPSSPIDNNNNDDDDDVLTSKPSVIPRHIAVIMDGNRRFGKEVHSDPLQVN